MNLNTNERDFYYTTAHADKKSENNTIIMVGLHNNSKVTDDSRKKGRKNVSTVKLISGTSYDITTIGTSVCLVMRCLLLMLCLSKSGVFLPYKRCPRFDHFSLYNHVGYRSIEYTVI